jgi:hypothetical protein
MFHQIHQMFHQIHQMFHQIHQMFHQIKFFLINPESCVNTLSLTTDDT